MRERSLRGFLDVRSFYIRRILRIWPLYYLYLIFAYVITFFVPGEELTWKHLLGYLFFAGNWVYFLMPINTIAAPLWSVSLEEQFYLIWPWAIRRSSPQRLAGSALGLMLMAALVTLALGIWQPQFDWISMNSFTRVDGIAVGALLAVLLRGRTPQLGAAARIVLLLSSVAVLLWIAHDFGLFELPVALLPLMSGWPLAAMACGGILLSVLGSTGRWSRPLRSRPIIYLGRISYGLYVYHELLLKIGDRIFPQHASVPSQMIAYWTFGLITTLPIAAASYRFIESPFLRLKRERFTVVESRPD
jgi:peptidoglycan/LPS O-acetylase OafA/YrhL